MGETRLRDEGIAGFALARPLKSELSTLPDRNFLFSPDSDCRSDCRRVSHGVAGCRQQGVAGCRRVSQGVAGMQTTCWADIIPRHDAAMSWVHYRRPEMPTGTGGQVLLGTLTATIRPGTTGPGMGRQER